jgi:hypothetical protein
VPADLDFEEIEKEFRGEDGRQAGSRAPELEADEDDGMNAIEREEQAQAAKE